MELEEFSEEMSSNVRELLYKIKFISRCPENQKLSFQLNTYVDSSWWLRLKKYYYFETHNTVITVIEKLIENISEYIKNAENCILLSLFERYLDDMKAGLNNLKETYKNKPYAFSKLDTLINNVEMLRESTLTKKTFDVDDEKEEDEDKRCIICFENKIKYIFIPCGHFIVCGTCAKRVYETTSKCPTCRHRYTNLTKVFY